jgi:hypothetical protein
MVRKLSPPEQKASRLSDFRIATHITIAVAPERVWTLLTDFEGYPRWNPYLVRVEGAPRAGSALTVHAVMLAGQPPLVQTVDLVAIAPQTMHWRGGLPDRTSFVGDHYFEVAATDGGTRFDHSEIFGGALAPSILDRHGALIRANFERFNAALKAAAEAV